MKDKVIAFDLDGTLTAQLEPSDYTYQKINELVKTGYKICIITGRQWRSVKKIYEKCNLNTLCVLSNGAVVYDPINDITYKNVKIPLNDIYNFIENKELMSLLDDMMCELDENIFSLNGNHNWDDNQIVGSFKETLYQAPNGLLFYAKDPSYQSKIKKIIDNNENYEYRYFKYIGEIVHHNLSKKEGAKILLDYYKKNFNDLVFFGDSINDIELLKEAKYSIAMSNAIDEVKKYAKYETDEDAASDGAIKYLLKTIKNGLGKQVHGRANNK